MSKGSSRVSSRQPSGSRSAPALRTSAPALPTSSSNLGNAFEQYLTANPEAQAELATQARAEALRGFRPQNAPPTGRSVSAPGPSQSKGKGKARAVSTAISDSEEYRDDPEVQVRMPYPLLRLQAHLVD